VTFSDTFSLDFLFAVASIIDYSSSNCKPYSVSIEIQQLIYSDTNSGSGL